jgi:hypothetical protein
MNSEEKDGQKALKGENPKQLISLAQRVTFEQIEKFLFRATLLIVFILELAKFLWHQVNHW